MQLISGLAFALALSLVTAPQAFAQSEGDWHIQSWSSAAMPVGATIEVQAAGSDERAQDAADAAAAALKAQGYAVSEKADIVLRVHLEDGAPAAQSDPRFGMAVSGGNSGDTKVQMEAQLKSNRAPTAVRRVGLQLYLFKRGEAPIWTANITAPRAARDPDAQIGQLAEAAMRYFGTEANKSFNP